MLSLILYIFLFASINAQSLALEKRACNTEKIIWIPDYGEYYEEQVELSLASRTSMNPESMTRILKEECKFEKDAFRVKRKTNFMVKGAHDLYHKLKKYYKYFEHVMKVMSFVEVIHDLWSGGKLVMQFFELEEMKEALEDTFRTSIQLLISGEKIPEIILNHPNVLSALKQRIPIQNQQLLSRVAASDVTCYQRDKHSQVVMVLKLKVPRVYEIPVKKCDDISVNNGLLYHVSETELLRRLEIDIKKCFFESFAFCPPGAVREINCKEEDLKICRVSLERKGSDSKFSYFQLFWIPAMMYINI
ncbi:DUF19 domain-containing protein [Caenorhabditis elegans]|uniref:DUF19 domain-containing protein n=1 Tax=Caenorhabditis elegans TaxID=6239 RepID=Q19489_CAEEL|nr:DUF19 domain-containing protein [Caenorhabditis elegans]CAA98262.4 DUF19 domain-containing protein [Caenorhabditis elegans]|eukprot:NP_505676.4 Uncharacterized protein CELE_F15H10.5 [Caenorhabditis elegans]